MATEDGAGPGRLRVGRWLPPHRPRRVSEDEAVTVLIRRPVTEPAEPAVDDEHEQYRGRRRAAPSAGRIRLAALGLVAVTAAAVSLRLAFGGGAPVEETPLAREPLPASIGAPSADDSPATPSAGPTRSAPASPSPSANRSAPVPKAPLTVTGSPSPSTPPPGSLLGGVGLCAEVPGGATSDGTQIRMAACTGAAAQRWARDGQTVRTLSKCLDVRGAARDNGTVVQLYQCNSSTAQNWEIRGDGTVRNPNSGRCLTIDGSTTEPGGSLVIRDCAGGPAQVWRLV